MLYLILGWLLLGLVAIGVGNSFLVDLNTTPSAEQNYSLLKISNVRGENLSNLLLESDRLLLSLWLGISTIALTLLALSLFMPLTPLVGLGVGIVGLGIGAVRRSLGLLRWNPQQILGWGVTIVGVAAWCNQSISWHDTGYYHSSLVQWLGQYGTVPGLALLFNNLGFTSSWFALSAPFNAVAFEGRSLALVNGLTLLLLLGQGIAGIQGLMQGRQRMADRFSVCWTTFMLPLVLFLDPLSQILRSPSPDLPVTLLVGLVAWMILLLNDPIARSKQPDFSRPSASSKARLIPLGLSLFAVTFKLIALPLIPGTFLLAVGRSGWSGFFKAIGLTGLILSPMIAGNLITSGCPLYPGHVFCLDLPWSPAPASLEAAALMTHGWTHWYGTPPPGANPWVWSLGQWFTSSSKEKITALGIVMGFTIVLTMALQWLIRLSRRGGLKRFEPSGEFWICAIGMMGLVFVMATSPFFRFSAPYIVMLLAIGLARILSLQPRFSPPSFRTGSIVGSQFDSHVNSRLDSHISPRSLTETSLFNKPLLSKPLTYLSVILVALCFALESRSMWLPPAVQSSRLWLQKETNGIVYRSPRSDEIKDMCWAAEIPCAYKISADIHLRMPDRGLAGGFIRH